MPSSAASFCTLPRLRSSSPANSSCSGVRRASQPRLKLPSITTPLAGHSSRVTISSPPLIGSRVISGCSGSPHLAIEQAQFAHLAHVLGLDAVQPHLGELVEREVAEAELAHLADVVGSHAVHAQRDELVERETVDARL